MQCLTYLWQVSKRATISSLITFHCYDALSQICDNICMLGVRPPVKARLIQQRRFVEREELFLRTSNQAPNILMVVPIAVLARLSLSVFWCWVGLASPYLVYDSCTFVLVAVFRRLSPSGAFPDLCSRSVIRRSLLAIVVFGLSISKWKRSSSVLPMLHPEPMLFSDVRRLGDFWREPDWYVALSAFSGEFRHLNNAG